MEVSEDAGSNLFYPYHFHRDLEINHFISGSGIYKILGRDYEIAAGDTFVFNQNEIHRITHIDPGNEMRILKVHFNPELLFGDPDFIYGPDYLNIFFDRAEGFENRLPGSAGVSARIGGIIGEMRREYEEREVKYGTMLKISLLHIFVLLFRYYDIGSRTEGRKNTGRYTEVIEVIKYIDLHFAENGLSIEELAKIAYMSENSLMRLFRQFYGTSIYSYIVSKRIALAYDLLRGGDKPVTGIAYECGFNNTVSFNKMFRKITGRTPTEVRKSGK